MRCIVTKKCLQMGLMAAVWLGPFPVAAQDVDPEALALAQKLVEQAMPEMDQKNFVAACAKLEKATKLVPGGVGGHLLLGTCYEGLGRQGSAWYEYSAARIFAEKAGDTERASKASAKLESIQSKVSTLTIIVSDELRRLPGLAVTRDGTVLQESRWGIAAPLDTGVHRLEVTAPGHEAWRDVVTISDDGAGTEIRVPMLVAVKLVKHTPTQQRDSATTRGWLQTVGFASIGIGVTGGIMGAVLGGMARQQYALSNVGNRCDALNLCNARGLALRDEAYRFAAGSNASFAAGGVFFVGGLVAALISSVATKKDSSSVTTTTVGFDPFGRGMYVLGTF